MVTFRMQRSVTRRSTIFGCFGAETLTNFTNFDEKAERRPRRALASLMNSPPAAANPQAPARPQRGTRHQPFAVDRTQQAHDLRLPFRSVRHIVGIDQPERPAPSSPARAVPPPHPPRRRSARRLRSRTSSASLPWSMPFMTACRAETRACTRQRSSSAAVDRSASRGGHREAIPKRINR